jgi:hypothetical protein
MKAELAILCFILSSCAAPQPIRYAKDGGTQDQFTNDRYECLQEAQQRVSGAR